MFSWKFAVVLIDLYSRVTYFPVRAFVRRIMGVQYHARSAARLSHKSAACFSARRCADVTMPRGLVYRRLAYEAANIRHLVIDIHTRHRGGGPGAQRAIRRPDDHANPF